MSEADPLKALCRSLASRLMSARGGHAVEVWEALGLGASQCRLDTPGAPAMPEEGPQHVGIWKAEPDGSWPRDIALGDTFHLWANVDRIPAKPASLKRIVLVGESTARGWFYDPAYTPAGVLKSCLDKIAAECFEVIDLARTSLSFEEMMSLGRGAQALDADVVVFFAGNNWFAWDYPNIVRNDAKRRCEAAAVLREYGVPGLKAHLEQGANRYFTSRLSEYFPKLSKRSAVMFVIPAYNLLDWHWEMGPDIPSLPENDVARWVQLSGRGASAFEEGNYGEAEALAGEMHGLDKGTAVSSLELLARCKLKQGLREEACELLTQARDAHSYLSWQTPKTHRCIEQAIRSVCQQADVSLVDLPAEFSKHAEGGIPGRRYFLDHCHMTAEGIRIAMAAVSETIAGQFGISVPPREQVLSRVPQPGPDVQGAAHLAACMHSAQLGQPSEIIAYHLKTAVTAYPPLARALADYLELHAWVAPNWMCNNFEGDRETKLSPLRRSQRAGIQRKGIQQTLMQVFGEEPGTTYASAIAKCGSVLRAQRGVAPGNRIDLLEGWFSGSFADERNKSDRQFFVAHAPVSTFPLICATSSGITLCLTCRRHPSGDMPTTILVNGEAVAEIQVTPHWRTWRIPLPSQTMNRPVNTLAIRWPDVPIPAKEVLEQAADEMERGQTPTIWPIFGEIHALRAGVTGEDQGSLPQQSGNV